MRDFIWNLFNDWRVRLIRKHAPVRKIERISRVCRWIYPRGYHVR